MADEDQYPELEPGIPIPEEPMVESRRVPSLVHATPFPIVPPEGVVLPSSLRNQPYVPTDPAERQMMAMSRAFEGLPIAQAEKAVETALKFQGMRTYQRALSEGKSADEAMRIAGPMIFGSSGLRGMTMTPYQQAALAQRERDMKLREDQAKRARTLAAAGGIYRVPAEGPAETLVAPRETPRNDPYAIAEFRNVLSQIASIQDAIAKQTMDPADGYRKLRILQERASAIRGTTTGTAPPPVATPPAAVATPRVAPPPGAIDLGGGVTIGGPAPAAVAPPPIRVSAPAPMAGMGAAAPMPKNKADLVAGRWYQTRRGMAKWDGEKFVK